MQNETLYAIAEVVLALLVVGGAAAIAIVSVLQHGVVLDIPAWLAAQVGTVIGFYYGGRRSRNGGTKP